MQRITTITIGKLNEPFYLAGVQEYARRLAPMCTLKQVELAEEKVNEKNASALGIEKALEKEAQNILAAVPKGAKLVALCVEGKAFTSPELANWLAQSAVGGEGDVAFVIGSSHGIAGSVKKKAALCLSLSSFTMPHQLARLVLIEQLYRAFAINNHSKYHK